MSRTLRGKQPDGIGRPHAVPNKTFISPVPWLQKSGYNLDVNPKARLPRPSLPNTEATMTEREQIKAHQDLLKKARKDGSWAAV